MRLATAYAAELGDHGVVGVAISPGWLRSEVMLENQAVTEDNWQDWYWDAPHERPAEWLSSETPRYTGRAIVALASDPGRDRWNGKATKTSTLASHYNLTDVNGTTPGRGKYDWRLLAETPPSRQDY